MPDFPYMPVYINDFLNDAKVVVMDGFAAGIYSILLYRAWLDKPAPSLPTDDETLAAYAKLSPQQWLQVKAKVLSCFTERNGRLWQKRQVAMYEEMLSKSRVKSSAGRLGGVAKAKHLLSTRQADGEHPISESNSDSPVLGGLGGMPPQLADVKHYAGRLGLPESEADKFFNYYTSNGWKVGKNAMKSWPHAVANWRKGWIDRGGTLQVMVGKTPDTAPLQRPAARRERWQVENDIKSVRAQQEKVLDPSRYGYSDGWTKMKTMAASGDAQAVADLATWRQLKERKAVLETELRTL